MGASPLTTSNHDLVVPNSLSCALPQHTPESPQKQWLRCIQTLGCFGSSFVFVGRTGGTVRNASRLQNVSSPAPKLRSRVRLSLTSEEILVFQCLGRLRSACYAFIQVDCSSTDESPPFSTVYTWATLRVTDSECQLRRMLVQSDLCARYTGLPANWAAILQILGEPRERPQIESLNSSSDDSKCTEDCPKFLDPSEISSRV